ncbi:hypothetical protein DPMN_012720 [Dreissena polymorpha]|uniref:Uncharacterized protein n=1 Tax=Dreissena polymorpha TaxID=45954 RepID=A0A9D4N3Y6_DREPO|nr:hypothetical protein DPMN_012720 [Dreissena polymorpha]
MTNSAEDYIGPLANSFSPEKRSLSNNTNSLNLSFNTAKVTKRFLGLLLHSSIILRGRMPGTEFLVPCQWTPVIGNASIAAQF